MKFKNLKEEEENLEGVAKRNGLFPEPGTNGAIDAVPRKLFL